jgi:hypothetical protein
MVECPIIGSCIVKDGDPTRPYICRMKTTLQHLSRQNIKALKLNNFSRILTQRCQIITQRSHIDNYLLFKIAIHPGDPLLNVSWKHTREGIKCCNKNMKVLYSHTQTHKIIITFTINYKETYLSWIGGPLPYQQGSS